MKHEMEGSGTGIIVSEAIIEELLRINEEHKLSGNKNNFSISFHPTDGGPTIGRGVFVMKTIIQTGEISGRFVPDEKKE